MSFIGRRRRSRNRQRANVRKGRVRSNRSVLRCAGHSNKRVSPPGASGPRNGSGRSRRERCQNRSRRVGRRRRGSPEPSPHTLGSTKFRRRVPIGKAGPSPTHRAHTQGRPRYSTRGRIGAYVDAGGSQRAAKARLRGRSLLSPLFLGRNRNRASTSLANTDRGPERLRSRHKGDIGAAEMRERLWRPESKCVPDSTSWTNLSSFLNVNGSPGPERNHGIDVVVSPAPAQATGALMIGMESVGLCGPDTTCLARIGKS